MARMRSKKCPGRSKGKSSKLRPKLSQSKAATLKVETRYNIPKEKSESANVQHKETSICRISRGQRKRQKRHSALVKKLVLVKKLETSKAKEEKQKKDGAFADLQDIQSLLNQVKSETQVTKQKTSELSWMGKKRKTSAMKEVCHLEAVRCHPAFKKNPFEAIQKHLKHSIARYQPSSNQEMDQSM